MLVVHFFPAGLVAKDEASVHVCKLDEKETSAGKLMWLWLLDRGDIQYML